ncbi:MAG: hypothetical protein WC881_00765 [Elusimicrobiota bacterium]|jgi:hypothetical protein
MDKSIRVHVEISFSPRTVRWLFCGLLLIGCASELASENVTLTTYYPAPSGVYTKMITTADTYLSTDGGNVGIGTRLPQTKLDIVRPAGRLGLDIANNGDSVFSNGSPSVERMRISAANGWIGFGVAAPRAIVDIRQTLSVSTPNCRRVAFSVAAGVTACAAGEYATFVAGLYANQQEQSQPLIGGSNVLVVQTGTGPQAYSAGDGYMQCCWP